MNASRLVIGPVLALFAATSALAHPGHVAEQAGHAHWLAYGAAGLAILIAVGGLLYWRRRTR